MNRKKVFLVKSAKSVVGGVALGTVWSVARWYASDPAFSDNKRFSVDWFGTWFFRLLGGIIAVGIAAAIVLGIILWVEWLMEESDDRS